MVSSSARGPSVSYQAVKPDIGAPGASVSAVAARGPDRKPSADLGRDTHDRGLGGAPPERLSVAHAFRDQVAPDEHGRDEHHDQPGLQPGVLAPISRIGGGEVRVDRALHSTTAAWDDDDNTGSLSFGYNAVASPTTLNKTVRVRNYGATARTYSITPSFRYADDAASGAVTLTAPAASSSRATAARRSGSG